MQQVLAIETSCDDTSVALVREDGRVLALQSAHQDLKHAPFGGIVPEIAGRSHAEALMPLIDQLIKPIGWDAVTGIAVTNRPGLIGSLIVGVVTAKSLSQLLGKPLIGVNHLEGHIVAPFLQDESYQPKFGMDKPFLALAVSGGHSSIYLVEDFSKYKVLGQTLDDAAGEAFDKFAKMVGLGFPGGALVDKHSRQGDPHRFHFPRALIGEDSLNMSFSGLKSASHRLLSSMLPDELRQAQSHLCASFQESVVDVLLAKIELAIKKTAVRRLVITGGVSANTRLRERATGFCSGKKVELLIPPLRYCTDNAAMIGLAGALRLARGEQSDLNLAPSPASVDGDFVPA